MEERKDEIPKRERWLRQLFHGAKAPNPYFYAALKEIRRQGQFDKKYLIFHSHGLLEFSNQTYGP